MTVTPDNVKVFGYGSLVNSHAREPKTTADMSHLHGWRRSWSHCVETERGKVCALTIVPNTTTTIAGVLVTVHRDDLRALDTREQGYERIQLSLCDLTVPFPAALANFEIFTYRSGSASHRLGSRSYMAQLSRMRFGRVS
jgi:hypothetical protein